MHKQSCSLSTPTLFLNFRKHTLENVENNKLKHTCNPCVAALPLYESFSSLLKVFISFL